MLSVTFKPCMLSVIMLNLVMPCVVMLSVVAPFVSKIEAHSSGANISFKRSTLQLILLPHR